MALLNLFEIIQFFTKLPIQLKDPRSTKLMVHIMTISRIYQKLIIGSQPNKISRD